MSAYYNEHDPYAAEWLRNLIAADLIPRGTVDTRSITDVPSNELNGYTQCHFFAGIGGWPFALRLAGWDDARPVWTGSCPCQPFSNAGEGGRQSDERHLWPHWDRHIGECRPPVIFGEQVDSAIRAGWLDDAFCDLEAKAYACAAAVLRAKAFGAAHERDRLFFVAESRGARREGHQPHYGLPGSTEAPFSINGDPITDARRALAGDYADLLPLDGVSVAVERCAAKGYGNAIVPKVAASFIRSYMEATA